MRFISLEQYDEKQNRAVSRVLDLLDRMESRTGLSYRHARRYERSDVRATITLRIPADHESGSPLRGRVWARSISQSGLSFVYPTRLGCGEILVGIDLPSGECTWMHAEIVRARQVADEPFWEYGVKFLGRAETE